MLDIPVALVLSNFCLVDTDFSSRARLRELFEILDNRVVFRSTITQARFEEVLAAAWRGAEGPANDWISIVFTQSRPGGRPMPIRIIAEAEHVGEVVALIILLDLNRKRHIGDNLLRTTFGLTPAEASLAAKLAVGATLKEICAESGVRISTLHTQIAGFLAKTETRSQAHLPSLLAMFLISGADDARGSLVEGPEETRPFARQPASSSSG